MDARDVSACMTRTFFLLALLSPLLCASAANWPMWRGAHGDGTCEESGLSQTWSQTENIAWKVALPDRGNSTPVIWGDKLFLTQAIEKEGKRLLLCFDKKTGKQLWDAGTIYKEQELTHATNPYCAASPATDGERVIAFFASAGVFCYDLNGQLLWKRTDLGKQHHIWGNGTSPVIAGDRVFLNFGPGPKTTLYCFDKKTGKTLWEYQEPGGDSGEAGNKNWLGSWADPLLRKVGDHEELFMSYPGRVCAFDPASGRQRWTCEGLNKLVYNSPLFADGMVIGFGGYNGMGVAVKAGGVGDVTATHRVWLLPKVSQRIGSGVVHDGYHYILSDGGIVECRSLKDGTPVFQERLKGQNWSSLVLSADGLCYAANQIGDCFVFKASPKFELLATNSLGEKIIGSIAVSDGHLFIRGYKNLWCIGRRQASTGPGLR
jgi:outer membrane protein assembly factor BamB